MRLSTSCKDLYRQTRKNKNCTGGPRCIREKGTPKIGSHITNSHIKRPRITVNQRIGSRKEAISGSNIREITDKKTAYNEGCL